MNYHWLNPLLRSDSGNARKGQGLWTTGPIAAGSLLLVWGGRVLDREAFGRLSRTVRSRSLQIEDDLFLVSKHAPEPADLVNHSCAPNAGLRGQIALEARIDLLPNVEVTFDYAMSDGSDYDEFPCACGSVLCRGWVRGDDWRRPDLQHRYAGHFSPYLARKIERTKLESTLSEAFAAS